MSCEFKGGVSGLKPEALHLRGGKIMKQLGLGIIVAIGLTLPAFGQSVDPLIGTWKLNHEKSTSTFPAFKSGTLAITGEGQNRTLTAEAVDANSQSYKIVYRHIYDGQPHPTTGSPDYDSSTYTRIGNAINGVRSKEGKPVEVMQGIIDPGKNYTVRAEGIAANGEPYHYVYVYDRQ
jgi:hypothetical protein